MNVVVRCINKIRARDLYRRQFRNFIEELEEIGELLLHCEIRWLSKAKSLQRISKLRHAVIIFLQEKNILPDECAQIKNGKWLNDFAFLTDITNHLNILNLQLQGKEKLFTTLVNTIDAFKIKLTLFSRQLGNKNLDHFENLKKRNMLNNMGEERIDDNSEDSSYEDFKDEPEDIGTGRYRFQFI